MKYLSFILHNAHHNSFKFLRYTALCWRVYDNPLMFLWETVSELGSYS